MGAKELRLSGFGAAALRAAGWSTAELEAAGLDAGGARELAALPGHTNYVYSVCALGGERLASGSDDNTVRVWDLATGEAVLTLQGHTGYVNSVCALGGECRT